MEDKTKNAPTNSNGRAPKKSNSSPIVSHNTDKNPRIAGRPTVNCECCGWSFIEIFQDYGNDATYWGCSSCQGFVKGIDFDD